VTGGKRYGRVGKGGEVVYERLGKEGKEVR
jgi:hypothetical protein